MGPGSKPLSLSRVCTVRMSDGESSLRLQAGQHRRGVHRRRRESAKAGIGFRRLGFLHQREVRAGDKSVERHRQDQPDGKETRDPLAEFLERRFASPAAFAQQHAERWIEAAGFQHLKEHSKGTESENSGGHAMFRPVCCLRVHSAKFSDEAGSRGRLLSKANAGRRLGALGSKRCVDSLKSGRQFPLAVRYGGAADMKPSCQRAATFSG